MTVLTVHGKCTSSAHQDPYHGRFLIVKGQGGAKSKVLTSSLSPGGGVYGRAPKAEKPYSPPFSVGWGGGGRGYK